MADPQPPMSKRIHRAMDGVIDPETARQAVQAWTSERDFGTNRVDALARLGDALTVLVPQLLDQLAQKDRELAAERFMLEGFRDERNEWKLAAKMQEEQNNLLRRGQQVFKDDQLALGERCHQQAAEIERLKGETA